MERLGLNLWGFERAYKVPAVSLELTYCGGRNTPNCSEPKIEAIGLKACVALWKFQVQVPVFIFSVFKTPAARTAFVI